MITEIKQFRTTDPHKGIPEALEYAQKNKCDIMLSVGVSGAGEIIMNITGKETVEILHMRLKEAIVYVHKKFKSEEEHQILGDGSKITNIRLGTHVVKGP